MAQTTKRKRAQTSATEAGQFIDEQPQHGSVVLWQPQVSAETLDLLKHLGLDDESAERVRSEAVDILSRCLPPDQAQGRVTGLAVGYVQSGKTMSFTTVTALARDNGYRLVVILAGTSVPLLEQSIRRIQSDLRINSRKDRQWLQLGGLLDNAAGRRIADTLADWRDPEVPDRQKKTVLAVIMKHHEHLDRLRQILSGIDLQDVPAIIIDDEADQASLNAYVRRRSGKKESATYERIIALRSVLPRHTFLQYTATPQAPLLISIIDDLAPSFAEPLTPGADYVGGKEFFRDGPAELVRVIPDTEISKADQPLQEPPKSLLEAMQVFFLGVAAGLLEGGQGHRSMLVHPSQGRIGHQEYFGWVTSICGQWKSVLSSATGMKADRKELLNDFKDAYKNLRKTVPNLASFETLADKLPYAIRSTHVELVNAAAGSTPIIEWSTAYGFLLVGGQAMDRGFTVEGLTVTYMPRGAGVGNVDTIQQRARFFGYKRSYLGYCRVYLENFVRDAYVDYVRHEEHVRSSLFEHKRSAQPLSQWKRRFFLDAKLKPTRRSVMQFDYARHRFGEAWVTVDAPHVSGDAIRGNREITETFLSSIELRPDRGDSRRTEAMRHKYAEGVALRDVFERLLLSFRAVDLEDAQQFTALLVLISSYLEDEPNAECTIYQMSAGKPRERGVDDKNQVKNLFQGANPNHPKPGVRRVYEGDRSIRADTGLTVQVHTLDVTGVPGKGTIKNVPTLAVWVPEEMAGDMIIQEQRL